MTDEPRKDLTEKYVLSKFGFNNPDEMFPNIWYPHKTYEGLVLMKLPHKKGDLLNNYKLAYITDVTHEVTANQYDPWDINAMMENLVSANSLEGMYTKMVGVFESYNTVS